MVFGITDGVSTPEEVTPWEGEAHGSGDENLLFHPVLKHSVSLYRSLVRVGPSWSLLDIRPGIGLNILTFANMSDDLSQSSGEPILAFIGCKTGGKPNR